MLSMRKIATPKNTTRTFIDTSGNFENLTIYFRLLRLLLLLWLLELECPEFDELLVYEPELEEDELG